MSIGSFLGRWLQLGDDVHRVDRVDFSFAAGWAQHSAGWILFAALAAVVIAAIFYIRWQHACRAKWKSILMLLRGTALLLIVLALAEPVLSVHLVQTPKPWLWFLLDGTDSMNLPDQPVEQTAAAVPMASSAPSRIDASIEWLRRSEKNTVAELAKKFRLKAFVFDRPDAVRELVHTSSDVSAKPVADDQLGRRWAEQWTATGESTPLGAAFEHLIRQQPAAQLAGVVVLSDFNHNSGSPPESLISQLGSPVYTIGVGPQSAADVSVQLQSALLLKRGERTSFTVVLRHSGMSGRRIPLRLTMTPIANDAASSSVITVSERDVELTAEDVAVEIPFTPTAAGRFTLQAEVPEQPGESVSLNNAASRDLNVQDDFLRLMFVEYEPTWEWRFIKEVFHRDRLVGQRGFRTFLNSADPAVRRSNPLFTPTLSPRRSEFFTHDVVFLGDVPNNLVSQRFSEMTREFVATFGGGLVVIAGPRFGPGQLLGTPLAEMLPVVPETRPRSRDRAPFRLQLTPAAAQYDFMQLGTTPDESARAWDNLGELTWYHPSVRLHPLATALAVHPTDKCSDGVTPQPLIAVRKFGDRGEVVYVAFNETWRLRRLYGEKYYRQFWGQMIHRLGLSHALGSQKRFVVKTDRLQYRIDEPVLLSVDAFDADYEPLDPAEKFASLTGEIRPPGAASAPTQPIRVPGVRSGLYEARVTASQPGEHRIRVADPITGEYAETRFTVTAASLERRTPVRNSLLQRRLAEQTGGRTYELSDAGRLVDDVAAPSLQESTLRVVPLWNNWAWFSLLLVLLIVEWAVRKLVYLP